MPKPSKKVPTVATRPISDFFIRKAATAPQTAKSPATGQSATAKPTKPFASPPEKSVAVSFPSATKSTLTISDASSPTTPRSSHILVDAVQIVSPNRSAMKSQFLMLPSLPPIKCSDSMTSRAGSLSPHPTPGNFQKTVFDSDSDVEMPPHSVYVLRSPARPTSTASVAISAPITLRATENLTSPSLMRTNSKKKRRISSPEPCSELVPTSQSDELELAPTISSQRDPKQVNRSVDEWRHNTASAPSFLSDDIFIGSSNVPSFNFGCTPPRDVIIPAISPLPPSPLPLDPKTKAEQIIADIKAKAADSLKNRPQTPVREFKDELSDSDDDDMFPVSPMKGNGKATASTLQASSSAAQPHRRYGLRKHEASSSPSAPKQPSGSATSTKHSRVTSTPIPVALTEQKPKGKRKTYNPLDELLKEKKRDDERGKGADALRQAEAALAQRDAIMSNVENDDFTSEAAAKKAVMERKGLSMLSSSPGRYEAMYSDDDVDDNDRKRLLGEEHGNAVANLLKRDKASRLQEKEIEKPVGVPLWRVNDDAHDLRNVDQATLPTLDISNPHPLLLALLASIARNALSVDEIILSNSAFQALTQIWGTSLHPVSGLSFACILSTLTRLGAQTTVFDAMGWTPVAVVTASFTPHKQNSLLHRLVALVTTSARYRRLRNEEISDILMAMILVANDPTSSSELQCEIALAIDAVCASISSGGDISASIESAVCTKVLKYLSTLEPVNKAYITALFGSGSGRTRRIGRWIAHAIITNKTHVPPVRNGPLYYCRTLRMTLQKRYSDLPPILPLLGEFTRQHLGGAVIPGKFEQHDATDFVDMAFYVQILGVAVTNIVGYVMEERQAPRPRSSGVQGGLPDSPLVLLQTAIENIHAQISDIRATHLDRSQTKAALKELSLRIHYQRQVAQQSFRSIRNYFSKKQEGK
ncbi:hypothetical protein C0991_005604 [Blastosporella zonata]|nr:hypothetical protein C0991_005604 [Blastosporella zonata]